MLRATAAARSISGGTDPKYATQGLGPILFAKPVEYRTAKQTTVFADSRTDVTDAGLIDLKGLTHLEFLVLSRTQVTDAGLAHLKGLTKLRVLELDYTEVTDEGVKGLKAALPKCRIFRPVR